MKIAIVLGRVTAKDGGGFTFQDSIYDALLELADSSSHEFIVLGSFPKSLAATKILPRNISVVDFNVGRIRRIFEIVSIMSGSIGLLVRAVFGNRLDRELRKYQAQVVWFATPFFQATDLPYIYTVWDLQHSVQPWFPEVSSRGRWEYRDRFYRTAIARAWRIIVANRAARNEASMFYGVQEERLLCLPHPTPTFALNAKETPSNSLVTEIPEIGDKRFYLYPAQFGPHKNHITLLKALALAKQNATSDDFHVVLVGSDRGNLEWVRENAVQLGIADRVHIFGFVSRDTLVALYRTAIGLVFPSYFGPENLPPLEAFALGCPVIAAKVAGAEEQLSGAALLFDPWDAKTLSEMMIKVSADPGSVREHIHAGYKKAEQWTAQDYVKAVCEQLDHFALVRACWP